MRNSYPGPCYRCGDRVGVGEGHFEKKPGPWGKWRLQHADCAIRWRGVKPPPNRDEALKQHKLWASKQGTKP